MSKRRRPAVREPLQVYLSADERALLDRLAADQGLSRAEVLRRGSRAYAHEQAGAASPVFDLVSGLAGDDWPTDIAGEHDAHLSDAYGGS